MKTCTKCGVEKPLEVFGVARKAPDGKNTRCKECIRVMSRAAYAANPAAVIERTAIYAKANREILNKAERKRRAASRPFIRAQANAKRAMNIEHFRAQEKSRRGRNRVSYRAASRARYARNAAAERERCRLFVKGNPALYVMYAAKRRANRLKATPPWYGELEHFVFQEAADLCKLRENLLGFKWHVDHVVPLVSPLVCGLHVFTNTQVIPAVDNQRKGNRYWPDMPGDCNGRQY